LRSKNLSQHTSHGVNIQVNIISKIQSAFDSPDHNPRPARIASHPLGAEPVDSAGDGRQSTGCDRPLGAGEPPCPCRRRPARLSPDLGACWSALIRGRGSPASAAGVGATACPSFSAPCCGAAAGNIALPSQVNLLLRSPDNDVHYVPDENSSSQMHDLEVSSSTEVLTGVRRSLNWILLFRIQSLLCCNRLLRTSPYVVEPD
jgi:hypothetical protein